MYVLTLFGESGSEQYVPFLYYLVSALLVIFIGAAGYYIGKFVMGRRLQREIKADRTRMFDIEKALKAFWDNERAKLKAENDKLSEKITLLTKQVDDYRKKAAGVGVMGLSKDKRADMLIQLMLENEALEEKLYELNLKMKQERDEYLAKELTNISYKRILLSEILKQQGVQEKIRDILKDDSILKKIELPSAAKSLPAQEEEPGEDKPGPEEEGEEEKKKWSW